MRVLNLIELQKSFHASIRNHQAPEELLNQIKDAPPISLMRRLGIYQNAYRIRLSECIREDFIETRSLMGNDEFELAIREYISDTPSRTSQLAEYSEDFVESLKKLSAPVYELASKEWLEILSSRAEEPMDKLTIEEIQGQCPYLVRLHPATKYKAIENEILVTYRKKNEIHFLKLNSKYSPWLEFFKSSKSPEELSHHMVNAGVNEAEFMSMITE